MNRVAYGEEMAKDFLINDLYTSHKSINLTLHKKTIKSEKRQFINWSLNRYPAQNEFKLLTKFFLEKGFIFISNNHNRVQYRKFLKDGTSIHISLWKKHYGFNIDIHIDIRPHEEVGFTSVTLRLLSALYVYLKDKYGVVFLLPRQRNEYQGYVSRYLPQERVNRKKNRPKRKLR